MADDPTKLNVEAKFDSSLKKGFDEAAKSAEDFGKGATKAADQTTKGVKRMSKRMRGAGDIFLESFLVFQTGSSKMKGALNVLGVLITEKLIGRLSVFTGVALGSLKVIDSLANAMKKMTIGTAAGMEELVTQFTPLLQSLEAAKQRVDEMNDFAMKTPFELEDIIGANKTLETLTRGALSGAEGMTMVGDAAAVAGIGFDEAARNIGRLYDSLQSGRAPGFAAMRLQELGLVSGRARTQLEELTASGKSGSSVWKIVADELGRTSGAMEAMEGNLSTLKSNFEDTVVKMKAGVGEQFLESEKMTTKALTDALEQATPTAVALARQLSIFPKMVASIKVKFIELGAAIVSSTGPIVAAFQVVQASLVAISSGAMLAGLGGIFKMFRGGSGDVKKASREITAGSKVAGSALSTLFKKRDPKKAWGLLKGAASIAIFGKASVDAASDAGQLVKGMKGVADVDTKGIKAGSRALGALGSVATGVLGTFKKLAKFVGGVLMDGIRAMKNPLFLMGASASVAAAAFMILRDRMKATSDAVNEMKKGAEAASKKLKDQAKDVRNANDATALYRDQVKALTSAQARLNKEEEKGNARRVKAAKDAVAAIKKTIADTVDLDVNSFAKSSDELAIDADKIFNIQRLKQQEREFRRTFMSPVDALKDLQKELDEVTKKADEAATSAADQKSFNNLLKFGDADRNAAGLDVDQGVKEFKEAADERAKIAAREVNRMNSIQKGSARISHDDALLGVEFTRSGDDLVKSMEEAKRLAESAKVPSFTVEDSGDNIDRLIDDLKLLAQIFPEREIKTDFEMTSNADDFKTMIEGVSGEFTKVVTDMRDAVGKDGFEKLNLSKLDEVTDKLDSAAKKARDAQDAFSAIPSIFEIEMEFNDDELIRIARQMKELDVEISNLSGGRRKDKVERNRKIGEKDTLAARKKFLEKENQLILSNAEADKQAIVQQIESREQQLKLAQDTAKIDAESASKAVGRSAADSQIDNIEAARKKLKLNEKTMDDDIFKSRNDALDSEEKAVKKIMEIRAEASRKETRIQQLNAEAAVASMRGQAEFASQALAEAKELQALLDDTARVKAITDAIPEGPERDAAIELSNKAAGASRESAELTAQRDIMLALKEQQALRAEIAGDSDMADKFQKEAQALRDQAEELEFIQSMNEANISQEQQESLLAAKREDDKKRREFEKNDVSRVVSDDMTKIGAGNRVTSVDPKMTPLQAEQKVTNDTLSRIFDEISEMNNKTPQGKGGPSNTNNVMR